MKHFTYLYKRHLIVYCGFNLNYLNKLNNEQILKLYLKNI